MNMHKGIARALLLALCITAVAGSAAAYDFNDVQWDPERFPIVYYINTDDTPAGFADLVQTSFNQYHRVQSSSLSFRYSGTTNRSLNNNDGFSTISWDATGAYFEPEEPVDPTLPPPPPVLAVTQVRTNAEGYIIEADTLINGSVNWSTSGEPNADEYDLHTAILREVGRWVQLEYLTDPADTDKVMYDPLEPGAMRQVLSQDEITAISEIYPAAHIPDGYETQDNTCSGATVLAAFDPDSGEYIGAPQGDHNIYPYDDQDWYTFTLYEPRSLRIATSGPDPLGDTEIYLYNSCPVGDPIGHADDVEIPTISIPSTPSELKADGSFTFRVNVNAGTVNVNNQLFEIAAREDVVIHSGSNTPLSETNSSQIYSVVAVENSGTFNIVGVPGAPAPSGSAVAPSEDEIDTAVGHSNWVLIGRTLFQLDGLIRQTNNSVISSQDNINIQLTDPTTPSSYDVNGGYAFRVDSNYGAVILRDTVTEVLYLPEVTDFLIGSGDSPVLTGDNTAIVYTVVARKVGDREGERVSVAGTPAPAGAATAPSDQEINDAVGSTSWVLIGYVQIEFTKINQSILDLPYDANRSASRYYAVLDASGLQAGTYYVKVQSSVAGGQPVVDPYSIVLLPGEVDVYEYDNLPDYAKVITPGEVQDRSIAPEGDVDWATFTLTEPAHIVLETFGNSGGFDSTSMQLWDDAGVVAENVDKADDDWFSRIEIPKLPAGEYRVLVEEEFGIYTIDSYQLSLTVSEAIGDLYEQDDTPETASQFTETLTMQTHTIDPIGDHDWISFELTDMAAGVEIETTGLEDDDLYLELYDSSILSDPNATPIASDDNSGLNLYAKISYFGPSETGLAAGTYYVLVREKDDAALTAQYDVSLKIFAQGGDAYEIDDVPAYAKELPLTGTQTRSITVGDVDWMKFTIDTSGTFSIETSGPDSTGDTDMYFYEYIGTGGNVSMADLQQLDHNDDIDYDGGVYYSAIEYSGLMPGTYYVEIRGYDEFETEIDPYYVTTTFTEDPREPNDPGETPQDALLLTNGVTSPDHTFSPVGDIDWYKINISELSDLQVDVAINGAVELQIYDDSVLTTGPGDTNLASGNDYDTLSVRAVDLDAGTYYIMAVELGNNQLVDNYSITANVIPAPDFRVRPPSMYFRGDWQNPPEPQAAAVRHLNNTTTWTATPDVNWITVTPATGSVSPAADTDIQVSVDVQSFPKGTQYGNITFTAADGSDPYTVSVSMEVTADPADIQWSDSSLSFDAVEGSIDPVARDITVTNDGGGDGIEWSIEPTADWLTVTPNSGTMFLASPTVNVSVQPIVDTLSPGTYTANLVFHGVEASPGAPPAQPQITFTVSEDTVKPEPLATTFTDAPHGIAGSDAITMTAVETVDDQLAPVEYYFEFLGGDTGGADSGWISSNTFEQAGLVPGGYYTYRVKARDASSNHNETTFSEKASGYVAPIAPPAPQISNADFNTLDITVSRGSNSPRVLLAIYNVTDDNYIGILGQPQEAPAWRYQEEWGTITATDLYGGTEYKFKVVAENGQGLQSDYSPEAIGYTLDNAPPNPAPTFESPGVAPHFEGDNVTMTCTESIDQSQPVLYYFDYVGPAGDGQDSNWQQSRTYTMPATTPGGEYAFRVKAKDANGFETDYSEVSAIYKPAVTPNKPLYVTMTDSTITISIAPDDNSSAVEYAITDTNTYSYADETGWMGVAEPVWQTRQEWGNEITISGYWFGRGAPVALVARNGDGQVTDVGPILTQPNSTQPYWVGYPGTLLPDTTPPAPNPIRWKDSTPSMLTSNGITIDVVTATDSKKPIYYEYVNVTTNNNSNWLKDATSYSFTNLQPCTQYEFKARAKDSATPEPHIGDWSVPLKLWTKPAVPGVPALVNTEDGNVFVQINTNGNSDAAEYAVLVTNLGKYVTADGKIASAEKVWQTAADWSTTYLTTLVENQAYSFVVYARNPDGVESAASPQLSNVKLDFTPPQPNPPVISQYIAYVEPQANAYLVAVLSIDSSTVSYYFDCIDDEIADSGWLPGQPFYQFDPTVSAGILGRFRLKTRDGSGNETQWSDTVELVIPPVSLAPPVAIGSESGNAYISILRGIGDNLNSKNADYAIMVLNPNTGVKYYVQADGTYSSQAFYQSYNDWGQVVKILQPPIGSGRAFITTKVRGPSGYDHKGNYVAATTKESSELIMTVSTASDTTPPSYSELGFSSIPSDRGTTWISMEAKPCLDPSGVMYGFEYAGGTIDWVWTNTYTAENLTPGATYSFRMRAKDGAGNMTPYSGATQVATLAATPGAPTVAAGAIQMQVTVDAAGNASAVTYAIYDTESGNYLAADGTLTATSPVYKTLAEWGQPVTVTDLQPDANYTISVKAKNPDGVETAFSPATEAVMVGYDGDAPTPNPPRFARKPYATSTTSIKAEAVEAQDDTGPVEYYFRVTGEAGARNRDWGTSNVYEIDRLVPGGKYTFEVRARDASIYPQRNYTPWSQLVVAYAKPEMPGQPIAGEPTTSGVDLSFTTGGNSPETLYAIRDTRTGKFVDASGSLSSYRPIWRSAADWGSTVSVAGLKSDSTYYFVAVAQSKDEVQTAYTAETMVETGTGWPIAGDANLDCKVNIIDLIFVRNRLNQDVTSGDNWQADVNSDGKINIIDLIYVRNRLNSRCQ